MFSSTRTTGSAFLPSPASPRAAQNRTALLSLTALRSYDNYTFTHMVNVSILTMAQARGLGIDGQVIALFVILLAAAEAAVALAITLNFYNNHATVDVDRADDLKG